MQFASSVYLSILAALSSVSLAAPVSTPAEAPLKMDFSVVRHNNATKVLSSSSVVRNAVNGGYLNMALQNQYTQYIAEFEIGTPGQKIRLDVDTGSSDLWVPGNGTQSVYGTYNKGKSTSYQKIKDGFAIGYGDKSYAIGEYGYDDMSVGGVNLKHVEFAVATNQTAGRGLVGIGFEQNESSNYGSKAFTYPNFPSTLKAQGVIKKNSYSLYLNSIDADTGSVLFGAIDEAKYEGDLKTLDLININDEGEKTEEPVAFFVSLDSISNNNNVVTTKSQPALLDSGTTLIYAPTDVWNKIVNTYGTYYKEIGGSVIDCNAQEDDFEFAFGDKTIKVPFSDTLFKLTQNDGSPLSIGGKEQCLVGFMNSGSEYYILGDGFLRSAYIFYDLDDKQVSIGQAKFTDETKIKIVS